MGANRSDRQNITVSMKKETVRKARILAAKRATSVSGLLAEEIERLIGADEAWEKSKRAALALLDEGFHLGGRIVATREQLHER